MHTMCKKAVNERINRAGLERSEVGGDAGVLSLRCPWDSGV